MNENLFEAFNNGLLKLPKTTVEFANIPWSKHPTFEGVEYPAECRKSHLYDKNFSLHHR